MRPERQRILTANLTAIVSDSSNLQRATVDSGSSLLILRGRSLTSADDRNAVFKPAERRC